MSRTTGPQSRLDYLLRRQTDYLVQSDSWKDFRSTQRRDDLRTSLRIGREPTSATHYSPLRDRLGTSYRHQSPVTKARDNFEAFYASLKPGSGGNAWGNGMLERRNNVRTPVSLTERFEGGGRLGSRLGSPRQTGDLTSVLTIDTLRQAKALLQRSGLNGLPASYLSELRAVAALVHSPLSKD